MIKRHATVGWLLLSLLLLVSCQEKASTGPLEGRITLWHSWSEAEAAVLGEALAEFHELHPGVRIIPVSLPREDILAEFTEAGNDGLGPGLIIGNDSWIGELVDTGLIRPLPATISNSELFGSRNRDLTQYEGQLFGVPLFLSPRALYYNKAMIEDPAPDLTELLLDTAAGSRIAFVPRFEEAYWGIQGFGEGFFSEPGRFTLAESGFAEWLAWLNNAQSVSGVILNVDDTSLLELFASGQIAYYVADPETQAALNKAINPEDPIEYGVVPLPAGPIGSAGPLLPAETILLYAFTSEMQTRIANALAAFLVNQQQSIRFMRELDRVPANPTVTVDQRIYPNINGFARQARTAVVIPNEVATEPLIAAGDRAYISVLSGVLTPAEATCRFGQEVALSQGYTAEQISLPEGCELPE